MKARKLELKDIAGYLPYGLKVMEYVFNEIHTIELDIIDNLFLNEVKPILRPLSDLYKTITHNGKEIVPIVELAKISTGSNSWELKYNCAIIGDDSIFDYDKEKGFIEIINRCPQNVYRQYQLFDYLHELKIDYRGLIDAGLAIDVNTLENNPYK